MDQPLPDHPPTRRGTVPSTKSKKGKGRHRGPDDPPPIEQTPPLDPVLKRTTGE